MARRSVGRAPSPLLLHLWRGHQARARRALRMLLVVLAVAGLAPLADGVGVLLADPHVAELTAAACDDDCDAACDDADCHGDLHHCGCCAPMPRLAPAEAWRLLGPRDTRDGHRPLAVLRPPERAPPRPWQPPRA